METQPLGPACSIARSLEVLGEKWTLLVVREAFRGATRFSEFRERLGVSSDILTARLATLVDIGVLDRGSYQDAGARERPDYRLTQSGVELHAVLASLMEWGDRNRPRAEGPATQYRSVETGDPVRLRFVADDGRMFGVDEVESVRLSATATAPRNPGNGFSAAN